MYRIKLVLGLRQKSDRTRKHQSGARKITGAIAVQKILSDEDTQIMGIDNAAQLAKNAPDETVIDQCVWINDLPFPKIFYELRKKFNGYPISTDAEVQITIGTMYEDIIDETIERDEYLKTQDSSIIRYFINRIKSEPKLRELGAI